MRSLLRRLCGRHPELGQEASVVGLHPLLGQPPVIVVPEETDHFPLEVLPSGLDCADRRVREHPGEVAGERSARRQNLPSTTICSRTSRSPLIAARNDAKYAPTLIEAQVASGSMEDVILREVGAERGVVLPSDCLVANADQLAGQGPSEMNPAMGSPRFSQSIASIYHCRALSRRSRRGQRR
jgi:hypothetical protein